MIFKSWMAYVCMQKVSSATVECALGLLLALNGCAAAQQEYGKFELMGVYGACAVTLLQ